MRELLIYSYTFQLFFPPLGTEARLSVPFGAEIAGVRRALEGHLALSMAFSQDLCPGDAK